MPAHPEEFQIHHGKTLGYCATADGTYTTIFDTVNLGFPEPEFGKVETTNDSTPNRTKAYMSGLKEPGVITCSYRYGSTQFAALEAIFALAEDPATANTTAVKFWKVTLPDGATGVAKGFITKHALPPGEGEDVMDVDLEIQLTTGLAFEAAA